MQKFIPNISKIQSKIVELYWNGKIDNIPSINSISLFCIWMSKEICLQIWCQELCSITSKYFKSDEYQIYRFEQQAKYQRYRYEQQKEWHQVSQEFKAKNRVGGQSYMRNLQKQLHKLKIQIQSKKHKRNYKYSSGERIINKYLKENYHHRFIHGYISRIMYKGHLHFDFWLPKNRIAIEYDGGQHFHPVEFWGGKKAFKAEKKRDRLKNEYCKSHNIRLIRIPYWNFNKVPKILSKSLEG